MRLRQFVFGFVVSLALPAVAVRAGQPVTPEGIDLIAGDGGGIAGGTVTIPISFVPGPTDGAPGGPDEIASIEFTVNFAGLTFDVTDANHDLIPDAVTFNPTNDATLNAFALFVLNPVSANTDHFISVDISDFTRTHGLPAVTLFTITFQIPPQATGRIPVTFDQASVFPVDTQNLSQAVNELVAGVVTVDTGPTPTPSETKSATVTPSATASPSATTPPGSPTITPTLPRPTARPTHTLGPPTVTPGGCPGGFECTISTSNGGCSIAASGGSDWPVLTGAALLLWARRRRSVRREPLGR